MRIMVKSDTEGHDDFWGVKLIWIKIWQGSAVIAVVAGGSCLAIYLSPIMSFLSSSL